MPTSTDSGLVASELRDVLAQLLRRLRTQNGLPLMHGTVLGRLDRCGPKSVSDLAAAERVRPQSMAQTVGELEADQLVARSPDPEDKRRALVDLTEKGREVLNADRRRRDGWLARALEEDFSPDEQAVLTNAVELLRRLAERPV
jgi:DNA-binding MarR family transcriptional regulator